MTYKSTGTGYVNQQRINLTERSEGLDSVAIMLPPILVSLTRHTDLARLAYNLLGQCTSLRRDGRLRAKTQGQD